MKRILFSFLGSLCFLSLMAAESHAKTCKPIPDSFYYTEGSLERGEYYIIWELGVPVIYFYSYKLKTPESLLVAAEFDKRQGAWKFHGKVPHYLIKMVHKKWLVHKTAYKACLGDYAWKNGSYYYAPYRLHHSNGSTYNWVVVSPFKGGPHRTIIIEPRLKVSPKKKKNKRRKKRKKTKERPAAR